MPCKDTKALVFVRLDNNDRLLDFDFSKVTCGKGIGGESGYKQYCTGLKIDEIQEIEFSTLVEKFDARDSEEQFLLYLEWDALRSVLAQYQGKEEDNDPDRYQIASVIYDGDEIEVQQIIHPPKSMPKVVSCHVRAKKATS